MATHVLSVTDGVSTLTLTSGAWMLTEYVMSYPSANSVGEYEPVTETIEFHVSGSGITTAVQTQVNTLETYFQRARQRQESGIGDRIYLQIQLANEAYVWRSELLGGEAEVNPDTLRAWNQALALIRVHITRKHFWEGPETLARLVQNYTGQSTTEQYISNYIPPNANQARNYLEIAANQIQGVLPTPAIIYQTAYESGNIKSYTEMYIALGKFRNPYLFTHFYEAELASGTGSVLNDNSCSGGRARQITASTTPAYMSWFARFTKEQGGRSYRVIARFATYTTTSVIYVRPIIRNQNGSQDLWIGEEVRLPARTSSIFVDLGTVPIPQVPSNTLTMTAQLVLGFRSSASAALTLDFVQLTPLDGFRILRPAAQQMDIYQSVVDNGVDELTYIDTGIPPGDLISAPGVDYYYPIDQGDGDYIMLYPGIAQRLYFLKTLSNGAIIADALLTKVYYRPRRLTI